MLSYLRLLRPLNLIIIALAQFLVRYCIILPAFQTEYLITDEFPSHLSWIDFSLLVFSTLMIAAAGYIINDVFDISMDEINRPGTNIIGKKLSEKSARMIYYILSFFGILIGFYLAQKIEKPVMGFVQVFTAASLWMYSSNYKRRFLSGNVLISLLSALSLIIVGLYEPEFYRNFIWLLLFAGFAFFVSLIREVIKDMEDMDGDERAQCKTIPVRLGIEKTKRLVYFFILLTSLFLIFILYTFFYTNKVVNFWYLVSSFVIPFIALTYLVHTAYDKKDYHYASLFCKLIMVAGILTMWPFYYYFLR